MDSPQPTFKRILIVVYVHQLLKVFNSTGLTQEQEIASFSGMTEVIAYLKQSDICVITEEEINDFIFKSQLNGMLEKTGVI